MSGEQSRTPAGEPTRAPHAVEGVEERVDHHRRMAEAYHAAYERRSVQDGRSYDDWVFAPHAEYWSPYFGTEVIDLGTHPVSVAESATMEARSYVMKFPDWGPVHFECWPSPRGFAMKTRFEGHAHDGRLLGFFAYGYVTTDERGRVTRWETHVNREYDDFLDVALGVHGPFDGKAEAYMAALGRALAAADEADRASS